MAELNVGNLRPLLDEEEKFAKSIPADDPRAEIAQRMLGIIAETRGSLRPSKDSTANFIPHKKIVEELVTLHYEADLLAPKK